MRVHCSGMNGGNVEGEVIRGEFYDPDTGQCELEDTFTVRRDDEMVFEVHGRKILCCTPTCAICT